LIRLPAVLRERAKLEICDARLEYDPETRILVACDRYGCSEVETPEPLALLPAPPILRPFTLTQVVYVEFERRVFVEKGETVWVKVPIDIEIARRGRPIARLSTGKAKYRLVGSLVEGVIARNVRSSVWRSPPGEAGECWALAAITIQKGADAVEGIPFNAGSSYIYRGEGDQLYLSKVLATITPQTIDTRTTKDSPLPGLKRIRGPPYGSPGRITALTQTAVVVERGWRLWPYLRS